MSACNFPTFNFFSIAIPIAIPGLPIPNLPTFGLAVAYPPPCPLD